MKQFPDFMLVKNESSLIYNPTLLQDEAKEMDKRKTKRKRKLLLSIVETNSDNSSVIGVEKLFSAEDIRAFKNLPDDIYVAILKLVEELDQKKAIKEGGEFINI